MQLPRFGRVKSAALGTIPGGLSGSPLPIAIDFGASSLKLLQLSPGDPPSLIAAASVEVPEGLRTDPAKRLEFQFQALGKLARAVPFRGKRAVCAIPAAQTFIKHMQFPRAENIDLPELVRSAVPAARGFAGAWAGSDTNSSCTRS